MLLLESALLAVAVLFNGAAAQCDLDPNVSSLVDAFSKIGTDASSVANNVNGFAASQGLGSALVIQSGYDTISADVATATSLVQALSSGLPDCQQSAIGSQFLEMAPDVVGLLQALSSKAPEFSSVGAQDIVKGDLTNLQPGVNTIEEQAYSKLACAQINSIYPSISAINDNFAAALSVYSGAVATPPTSPTSCADASSAPASSAEPSSAPASSGAESTPQSSATPSPTLPTASSNISVSASQPGSSGPASSAPASSSAVVSSSPGSQSNNISTPASSAPASSAASSAAPTFTCIAPGSPAAKYIEALENFDDKFGSIATSATWDTLQDDLPPVSEALDAANTAGKQVGMLSGCEAQEVADNAGRIAYSGYKLASHLRMSLAATEPPNSNVRRRKRATDVEALEQFQQEAIEFAQVLATIVPCDIYPTSEVNQFLSEAEGLASLGGAYPTSYAPVCGTSPTPSPTYSNATNSTVTATNTHTKTTITTTYVTTCPVCTGTHVESGTTITKATTITTTYCPEDTTPGVPGPTTVYTTTYVTTCPVTEGDSTVTKPTTITTVITVCPTCTEVAPTTQPPPAQTTPGGVTSAPVQTGGAGTIKSSLFGALAAVLFSALL